ncbi:XapX domain-containing protein [Desulforamulus ruminis]|uniref:XapX domain protein n=1 Tax=Desulforamulus ruminis (strain ATCC 23193 / DSM 2154 / NCIMB 8452 / DL) TaxID=696281 RepID=F6DP90_DESRL|nr:XapX domain-containing protein [Desulforamulus ruminis]AEG61919.1 XapX domain protein [Desulforamulus ruminis DSM 2154]
MKDIFLATVTGLAVGLLFARLKLPVPAPSSLTGVMGIVGIFLGYALAIRLGWVR